MSVDAERPHYDHGTRPSFDAMDAQIAEISAADNARIARILATKVLPLAGVAAIAAGGLLYLDHSNERAAEQSYSCTDFAPDILHPPTHDQLGYPNPGVALDGRQISSDGMQPHESGLRHRDGRPVTVKQSGQIGQRGDQVGGEINGLPAEHVEALIDVTRVDRLRWTVCNFGGGMALQASNAEQLANGAYTTDGDAARVMFTAGTEDPLFRNTRDVAYMIAHEGGHDVRGQILKQGTDTAAVEKIHQLDALYKEHLTLAVEEYRQQHGHEVAADLDKLNAQFQALDQGKTTKATKATLERAIDHIKEKLREPGGLAELAVYETVDTENPENGEVSLNSLDGMIAVASRATSPDGNALYGLGEYIEDYPDDLDGELLYATDKKLRVFLEPRFVSEHVMPGNEGGHAWDSSDETLAANWSLTGAVSENNYPKVIATVSSQYQDLALQELLLVAKLRKTADPAKLES